MVIIRTLHVLIRFADEGGAGPRKPQRFRDRRDEARHPQADQDQPPHPDVSVIRPLPDTPTRFSTMCERSLAYMFASCSPLG